MLALLLLTGRVCGSRWTEVRVGAESRRSRPPASVPDDVHEAKIHEETGCRSAHEPSKEAKLEWVSLARRHT